jgi:hypothetical protein
MSIASRFSRLLAASIDPEDYVAIAVAARPKARTIDDCIMELAEAAIDKAVFATLKAEAEARETQASRMVAETKAKAEAPPPQQETRGQTHVQARVLERYSFEVTRGDIEEIENLIRSNSPAIKLLKRQAVISCHYEVMLKGRPGQGDLRPKEERRGHGRAAEELSEADQSPPRQHQEA